MTEAVLNDDRQLRVRLGNEAEITSTEQDVEAVAVKNPNNTQGEHRTKVQTLTPFKTSLNKCRPACSCICHRSHRLKSPSTLESIIGSVLIKINGLYGMSPACNETTCSRRASAIIRIAYRFPQWFLDRMIFSVLEKRCHGRINGTLMVPRIIPKESAIFALAEAGDVRGVADLFHTGSASPDDIQAGRGFTPLHVG